MTEEASWLRDFQVSVQTVHFEVVESERGFSNHKIHKITRDLKCRLLVWSVWGGGKVLHF